MKPAIGLLGGTFDPIHFGHLRPALDILHKLQLARVTLIPNHQPPHRDQPGTSSAQRLAMVKLAIDNCPELSVDEREMQRDTLSYTVDTLRELRAELPDTPLCFLMGMDSLLSFTRWHRWQEILDLCHLVVSHRPGWHPPTEGLTADLLARHQLDDPAGVHRQLAGRIVLVKQTELAISSTQIRRLCRDGLSSQYLLPDAVRHYIADHHLYLDTAAD